MAITTVRGLGRAIPLVLVAIACAQTDYQETFASPYEAANALLAAVKSKNRPLFLSIVEPGMSGLWNSGDPVRDLMDRERFLDAVRRNGIKTRALTANRKVLYAGVEGFPAPLTKIKSGWRFDGDAGALELAASRLRRNETAAVEQCRRFLDAEFTYQRMDHGGRPVFAQRIRSTPGQHDGLFWADGKDLSESPLGPSFAAAAFVEKQPDGLPHPFGYYYEVLFAQGPDASGGALDYHLNGELRTGFALLAWPARYGVGGLHSNQPAWLGIREGHGG